VKKENEIMKNQSFNIYTQPLKKPSFLHEQLLDALPLLMFVTDKNDRIIYVNNKLSELINYNGISVKQSMKELISREDWNKWNENFFKLSNAADNKSFVFNINFNAEKDLKYLKLEGKVLQRDEQHKPLLYFFIAEDITGIASAEEKETEIINTEAFNKEVEEFVYVAGHDLQEPLRKIITLSSRLEYKFNAVLGDEGKLYLQKINTAADGMKQLIDNLLQISHTDEYLQPFEKTNLNFILSQALQSLDLKIEETHVTITQENLPVIEALPLMMTQLFCNLISNAIKFSSKNQAAVINICSKEIMDEEKQNLGLPADKSFYKIIVQDNGIGFDPGSSEKIFKIFYRLHSKVEYPGTGIGLAICTKIVEKHNGLIWAESEAGKGAAFNIVLPKTQG